MPRGRTVTSSKRSSNRRNAVPRRSDRAATRAATTASTSLGAQPNTPAAATSTTAEANEIETGSAPPAELSTLLQMIRSQVQAELEAQSERLRAAPPTSIATPGNPTQPTASAQTSTNAPPQPTVIPGMDVQKEY